MTPITVTTTVSVPTAKAWQVFTVPEYIEQWNFASADWQCPRAENPLEVGKRFNFRMEASDGSVGFDFEGTYTEIVTEKLIAYVLDDGRKVKVEFASVEGGTRVTETFDPETLNPLEMQRAGWQAILDNYKRVAEGK